MANMARAELLVMLGGRDLLSYLFAATYLSCPRKVQLATRRVDSRRNWPAARLVMLLEPNHYELPTLSIPKIVPATKSEKVNSADVAAWRRTP